MKKKNLNTKKGFLGIFLAIAGLFPVPSNTAPVAGVKSAAPNITHMSGVRMINLGTRYMVDVPAKAADWVLKNQNGIAKDSSDQTEEVKKIAKSLSDGMRNVGKILVLVGVAKEYRDYFEYQDNPKNPLNDKERYPPEAILAAQEERMKFLRVSLGFLKDKLAAQKIEADWLLKLFESNSSLSAKSIKFGIGQVGEVLEGFHIYGVGIQISSELPIGAMLSSVFSPWLPNSVENIGGRISMEDSVGVLFYAQKSEKQKADDYEKDPLYKGLDPKHPIFELLKQQKYSFAAKTYEQTAGQVEGVSRAHGSNKKSKIEVNITVRATFLASTEVLKNFDIMSMNRATIMGLSARQNIANVIPEGGRKIIMKAQEKIQDAYDKSKHLEFLTSNLQISAARVYGHVVDENTGLEEEVPNMLLRLSMGNYALEAVKDRGGEKDMINIKADLGSMTIDAN